MLYVKYELELKGEKEKKKEKKKRNKLECTKGFFMIVLPA